MRGMNSACVDLIYLDPPFNSKANYAAPIGSKAAGAAFKDTWTLTDVDVEWINLIEAKHPALYRVLLAAMTPSDKAYLVYMSARLLEMHRILKPTGSIYLHCDWHIGHHLKLAMDAIFGKNCFRNEIIWHYRKWPTGKYAFQRNHDVLFFYGKSAKNDHTFNQLYMPRAASTLKRFGTGKIVSGHDKDGDRLPSVTEGESEGVRQDDVWEIGRVPPVKQIYLTQKPLELLRRVIRASSNPGDLILDPFCGCATTCVAAQDEGRQWAGIDISEKAAELVERRMRDELGMFTKPVHRTDIPGRTDLGKLPPYRTHAPALYGLQGGYCAGCNTHFEPRNLEVDHIIARAKGGTDHIDNLQLLCGNCNRVKGDRGMEYLRTKLQLPRAA
ncbi:MAG: hypothetical protein F4X35_02265 [Alphaproteobacteria bacterium]|nr:hypothetical protein [Alphaproteobacteria bacterium]